MALYFALPSLLTRLWRSIIARYVKASRFLVRALYGVQQTAEVGDTEPGVHKCPRHLNYHRIPGQWRRELLPALPEKAFQMPDRDTIPYGDIYYVTKGHYLGTGATSFVERLNSGAVVKYPKPNPYCAHEENKCRQEIQKEAEVYRRIGSSAHIPTLVQWDEASYSLVLEYLEHGDLETYMRKHANSITFEQKHEWMVQATEALAVVHAANVIHCDVTPRNFMLDEALQLRIADFAGSSVSGSPPTRTTSPRFQPPGWSWTRRPNISDDVFALGSVLYFIQTGYEPYHDASEDEVEKRFNHYDFPDVSTLRHGSIIQRCWTGGWENTQCIASALSHKTEHT